MVIWVWADTVGRGAAVRSQMWKEKGRPKDMENEGPVTEFYGHIFPAWSLALLLTV